MISYRSGRRKQKSPGLWHTLRGSFTKSKLFQTLTACYSCNHEQPNNVSAQCTKSKPCIYESLNYSEMSGVQLAGNLNARYELTDKLTLPLERSHVTVGIRKTGNITEHPQMPGRLRDWVASVGTPVSRASKVGRGCFNLAECLDAFVSKFLSDIVNQPSQHFSSVSPLHKRSLSNLCGTNFGIPIDFVL